MRSASVFLVKYARVKNAYDVKLLTQAIHTNTADVAVGLQPTAAYLHVSLH